MSKDWDTLDTERVLKRQRQQQEQTTSSGVGGYPVPLGKPVRPPIPNPTITKKKKENK